MDPLDISHGTALSIGNLGINAARLNGQLPSYYLSRLNHTDSQAISTVTGLQAALDAKLALAGGTMSGALLMLDGVAATPAVSFSSDPDTGIYRAGTNSLVLIGGGATTPTKLTLDTTTSAVTIERNGSSITTLLTVTSSGLNASSGVQQGILINPTISQSGTAGYSALIINTTESSTGSGTRRLLDLQVGGVSKLNVNTNGGISLANGADFSFGSSGAGSKIGVSTSQKIGFWNVTPVVQQVLATGTGATVDNVISLLQTIGLCKQS